MSAGPTPESVNDFEGLGPVRVRRSPDFVHPLLQDKRRQPSAFASPYMRSMRRLHTRRTMPFQLIPHQPSAFVEETMPLARQSGFGSAADFDSSEMGECLEWAENLKLHYKYTQFFIWDVGFFQVVSSLNFLTCPNPFTYPFNLIKDYSLCVL